MNTSNRRRFLKTALSTAVALPLGACVTGEKISAPRRPNIILILTDDQGYGDMACHGNPDIDPQSGSSLRTKHPLHTFPCMPRMQPDTFQSHDRTV